jgi:hypothetical protein
MQMKGRERAVQLLWGHQSGAQCPARTRAVPKWFLFKPSRLGFFCSMLDVSCRPSSCAVARPVAQLGRLGRRTVQLPAFGNLPHVQVQT